MRRRSSPRKMMKRLHGQRMKMKEAVMKVPKMKAPKMRKSLLRKLKITATQYLQIPKDLKEYQRQDEEPEAIKDPLEDYPLPFTTVDESYFTDALFIGDSRLQGFGFWSGLPATYYCATGFQLYKYETTNVVQTEKGKVPIFTAMPYDAFTKIYIKVGLNELGYGTEENFEKTYAGLIEKLREYEPHAIIYVHAILPVTAEKSEKDKAHNNPNIQVRNEALKKFAKDQKAYFLDAGPALAGADGSLPAEMTNDGIHLKPEYMKLWKEYLCRPIR